MEPPRLARQASALSTGVSELALRADNVSLGLEEAGMDGGAITSSVAPLTELSDKLVDASDRLESVEADAHKYNGASFARSCEQGSSAFSYLTPCLTHLTSRPPRVS